MGSSPPNSSLWPNPNVFSYAPTQSNFVNSKSTNPHESPSPVYHIFYIPGNPGLVSFYEAFLGSLADNLNTSQPNGNVSTKTPHAAFYVFGKSLGGFEIESISRQSQGWFNWRRPRVTGQQPKLHSLIEQIEYMERSLQDYITSTRSTSSSRHKVILMGHSVGTYMMMEILRRYRERRMTAMIASSDRSSVNDYDIVGGIFLFPTVVDLLKSESGRRLGWLVQLPLIPILVATFARILTFLLPRPILQFLVSKITNFPPTASAITSAFLASSLGVRESLYMAGDEMRMITADKWTDEVWGVASEQSAEGNDRQIPVTDLIFYFGKKDHWVANETRETLIAARGGVEEDGGKMKGPLMLIDDLEEEGEGVPHGFCIRHSSFMANKVAMFVRDIVSVDRKT